MAKKVLIAGGAGYVGSVLVPKLIKFGYKVTVIDLMLFGENTLPTHNNLKVVKGDINDKSLVQNLVEDQDYVINLAVVTDETGQPQLEQIRKSTNLDACFYLADIAQQKGVIKFIYASSTSVYGNTSVPMVTEESKINPLTDYAIFKAKCEQHLIHLDCAGFSVCCVRPSTVFGYSSRQRFDLIVNNMTASARLLNKITVAGGENLRPNVHIEDIADFYVRVLESPAELIGGQIFNVAYNNIRIEETAKIIKDIVGGNINLVYADSADHRSYNVSSDKAEKILNFSSGYSLEYGVETLLTKLAQNKFDNPLSNKIYFNGYKRNYAIK